MLEDVPEVETVRAGDRVALRGRVSSLASWAKVEQVTAAFGDQILHLATLEMPPEILVNLRDGLKKAGFSITDTVGTDGDKTPGTLAVSGSGRTVYVSGSVYSQDQLSRINNVIAAQRGLMLKRDDAKEAAATSYFASVNVSIVPLIMEVDVAFIAVTDLEIKQTGANLAKFGLLSINLAGAVAGDVMKIGSETTDKSSGSLTYGVASSLSDTLKFFVNDKPDRVVYRGQLNFRNGAAEWQELHSGGTRKMRLVGKDVAKVEEFNYGFLLKAKGGLKDSELATLDMEFELSTPPVVLANGDYDVQRDRVQSSVDCKVGNTMVLGGVNSLLDGSNVEATPILRSIPLLSPFFSQKTNSRTDKQMLILVSPHITSDMGKAAALSEQNKKIMDISEKSADERLKEKRPRRFFFF